MNSRRQGLLILAAVLSGCASAPPPTATPATAAQRPDQPQRNDIAMFAMGLLDTRYRWGGRGPATGFDCSGLVSHVFLEAAGLRVTGSSAELGQKVRPVSTDQLLPGDLVFFNTSGSGVSHVGIYVGDGMMLHCGSPIQYANINSSYWQTHFYAFGRL